VDIGEKEELMDKENTFIRMEVTMKESGKRIYKMGMELRS
jgi:hypothetical protein